MLVLLFLIPTKAQITLRYDTHALMADTKHSTQQIEYINEGPSGANRIWDFSELECLNPEVSDLKKAHFTDNGSKFPETNICISDNENSFYFNVDEEGIRYYGLVTPNSIIQYNNPVTRMIYPFKFGDKYEGVFDGEGIYYGQIPSYIVGSYALEADAFGTLLLPDNVAIKSTLRVKTYNKLLETTMCNSTEITTTKYLWFAPDMRYPVLVILKQEIWPSNGEKQIVNSAYYNENAVSTKSKQNLLNISEYSNTNVLYKVFPNPYSESLQISYNLKKKAEVTIEIIDASGVKVHDIIRGAKQKGEYLYTFNPKKFRSSLGTFFVRFYFDNKIYVEKIIGIEK
jgi:hypothetical protein